MEEALVVLAMLVNELLDIVYEFFNVLLFDSWYTVRKINIV